MLTDQLFRNRGVLSEKSDNLSDMDECSKFGETQGVARDNLSNDTVIEEINPPVVMMVVIMVGVATSQLMVMVICSISSCSLFVRLCRQWDPL